MAIFAYARAMFADATLAAEIDSAEGRLCAGIAQSAARSRPHLRPLVTPVAGGLVVYAGPGSPTNKGIGLAPSEPLVEVALAAVEEEWRVRKEPLRIELSSLADPDAAAMLTARGYRLIGFENLLGRSLDGTEASATPPVIDVEPLATADEATWIDVTVDGFAQPDGSAAPHESFPRELLESVFTDMACTDGYRRYMARIDGRPVGAASMRIDGSIAQLCGAATLGDHRRRGVQTALLDLRLAEAKKAGCTIAVVTTQPGSKSQANSQRRGFAILYTRVVLVRQW